MTRRVLVTGATGFIGRLTLAPLRKLGFEVHVTGRSAPDDAEVTFHPADLFNASETREVLRAAKASHLLHLAWDTAPGKFWNSSINLDWVGASLGLLRAFAEHGGQRAVLAGTCAEYRWGADDPLDETNAELAPATLYGVSKDALRRILASYAETASLSVGWGRVFFLYGPDEKPGRLVSDAIAALSTGKHFETTEGSQRRDFMHVADVAAAFAALLASDARGAVNIASGEAVSISSILEIIARETGTPELLRLGARVRPVDDPAVIEAAVNQLRREVGFRPLYSLSSGLADTITRWQERRR